MKKNPRDLKVHPLLQDSPMLHPEHPDCLAIRESIEQHGFETPVKINEREEILDGRHRVREAIALGLEDVPVEVCPEADAADIIARSLLARRHLAKWQIAYCMADLIVAGMSAGVAARSANLRRGNAAPVSRKGQIELSGKTLEKWGISDETWDRVNRVRKALLERPDLREKYEPRMFMAGPEALSLEAVAKAIPSIKTYEEFPPDLAEKRKRYAIHVHDLLGKVTTHVTRHWNAMGARQRAEVCLEAINAVQKWPDEIKGQLRDALDEGPRK